MTDKIDRRWWKQSRERLENTFEQDEIVVGATVREALTGSRILSPISVATKAKPTALATMIT